MQRVEYTASDYINRCGGKNIFFAIHNRDFMKSEEEFPIMYEPEDGLVIHEDLSLFPNEVAKNKSLVIVTLPLNATVTNMDSFGSICYSDKVIIESLVRI